jgi:hypothetical protein
MDELVREITRPQRAASSRRTCPASCPAARPSSGPGSRSPHATWLPIVHGFSTVPRHAGTGTSSSAACSARLTPISPGQCGETPDQSAVAPTTQHEAVHPSATQSPVTARTGRGTRKPGPVSASQTSANHRPARAESAAGLSTTCPARQVVPWPPGSRTGTAPATPNAASTPSGTASGVPRRPCRRR